MVVWRQKCWGLEKNIKIAEKQPERADESKFDENSDFQQNSTPTFETYFLSISLKQRSSLQIFLREVVLAFSHELKPSLTTGRKPKRPCVRREFFEGGAVVENRFMKFHLVIHSKEHLVSCELICLSGESIAGIVGQPFTDCDDGSTKTTIVWGCRGVGTFGYHPVSPFPDKSRRVVVTTRSHFTSEIHDYIQACKPDKVWL